MKTLTLEMTPQNMKEKQEENYKSNNEEIKIPRIPVSLFNHEDYTNHESGIIEGMCFIPL